MSVSTIRTAILPVAGLGTRLLPATKTTPKELLPVYDTPLLQFAIEEIAAMPGIERIVVVTHPSKPTLEKFFEEDTALLEKLRRDRKHRLAETLENTGCVSGMEIRFVNQNKPLGLGHAVLCAAALALEGPVAVILPDDLILPAICAAEMADAYRPERAKMLIAAMKVKPGEISSYGCFNVVSCSGTLISAKGIVEKPAPGTEPSLFAAVGRYILPADIFDALARTAPGHQGEVQLTDAIAALAGSHGLEGYRFSGQRFDCGSHEGLLEAANWRRQSVSHSRQVQINDRPQAC